MEVESEVAMELESDEATDIGAMKDASDVGLASNEELAEAVSAVDDRYMVTVRVKVVFNVVTELAMSSQALEVLAEGDISESLEEGEVCKGVTTSAGIVVADEIDSVVGVVVIAIFGDDGTENTIEEETINELEARGIVTIAEERTAEEPKTSDALAFPEDIVAVVLAQMLLFRASKRSV